VVPLARAGRGAGGRRDVSRSTAPGAVGELLARRTEANARFFADEAGRIAALCRRMAERFQAGGRLLAVAASPQGRSDAHHVAVEFVHPVIVGKRALPALAVGPDELATLAEPGDMVIAFDPVPLPAGPLTVAFAAVGGEWEFAPPSADPFVRQELAETLYHVLWELVHVFFDHLGGSSAGAGASGFLYPFLGSGSGDLAAVEDDVRRSVLMKADDVARLREQTLEEGAGVLAAAAARLRAVLDAGGTLLALGNGGSATDAMDVVADFRAPPFPWPARRAVNLAADPAILSAIANDIGTATMFQRQVIALGRAGDLLLAISTSGGSANVIEALAEARRRGISTIALVGYDGGRIAAEGLADHVVVTRSEHIPRIQEAQASAYHVLRELVEAS
jgi:D-sedoheptulose 7-phosphate isomerase